MNKRCIKCNLSKDISNFGKLKRYKDGFQPYCRDCRAIETKLYRDTYPNKLKINKKNYRDCNKESISNSKKIHYEKNREKILISCKKYRNAHKKEIAIRDKKYAQSEHGKIVMTNIRHKRRYLKKKTSNNTLPLEVNYPLSKNLQKLLNTQRYKCNSCGCNISINKHLDHYIPLSKGGQHTLDNVQWLCVTCNLSKATTLPLKPLKINK